MIKNKTNLKYNVFDKYLIFMDGIFLILKLQIWNFIILP